MSYFEKREYQEKVFNFLYNCKKDGISALIELDCGLGKRIIALQLATKLFTESTILFLLHSSASLNETVTFFKKHISNEDWGWISSSLPHQIRRKIVESKRVILSTPLVLFNLTKKYPTILDRFDIVIINEIDKIIKRVGYKNHILVYPWNSILPKLQSKFIIGMSGTFRDNAILIEEQDAKSVSDLTILKRIFPNSKILSMDDIMRDVSKYITYTDITIIPIESKEMNCILKVLDEQIETLLNEIKRKSGQRSIKETLVSPDKFGIDEDTANKIRRLTFLRKFLVARPIKQVKRYFLLDKELKKLYPEVVKIKENEKFRVLINLILQEKGKVAVLSSYRETVNFLEKILIKQGIKVIKLTGVTRNKQNVLREFSEKPDIKAILISPVGERDLDLSMVNVLFILDVINTPKTMYQRIKRGRESKVYILYFKGTSEEEKVKRLLKNIKHKYPWSIRIFANIN